MMLVMLLMKVVLVVLSVGKDFQTWLVTIWIVESSVQRMMKKQKRHGWDNYTHTVGLQMRKGASSTELEYLLVLQRYILCMYSVPFATSPINLIFLSKLPNLVENEHYEE